MRTAYQTFDEPVETDAVRSRINALRDALKQQRLDAFLVPRGDEHQGEYVAAGAERLKWLTAFSGSAGSAVITSQKAALFVDGRYDVQARQQTDTDFVDVIKLAPEQPAAWLGEVLKPNSVVGFDPWLHTIEEIERLRYAATANELKLKPMAHNPIDRLWVERRPAPPQALIEVHPLKYAGCEATDKLAEIQNQLRAMRDDALLLTQPDSICWLLNIRGADVAHTPLVQAFALVPARGKVQLFVDKAKLNATSRKHLSPVATIKHFPSTREPDALKVALANLKSRQATVRLAPSRTSFWFAQRLGAKGFRRDSDPCTTSKAIKNKSEIRGAREAHVRDGLAMCRFLAWFDKSAPSGDIDEITAAKHLEACRADTGKLKEISFDTISGSGPNGAIVHYRVNTQTNRTIQDGDLYLVDSGAQYIDGTTDITRTVSVGTPSDEMIDRFTRVLKGHIAIATARFPEGTRGLDLDPLARQALWRAGLDYNHGTGHGVGSYLSVHEGPQSISKMGHVPLKPGMIISNEPGYYKEDAYGIRIENLVLVSPPERITGGDLSMLSFETLTLVPIDRRLINASLLETKERDWLNSYHDRVAKTLTQKLDGPTAAWLAQAVKPI